MDNLPLSPPPSGGNKAFSDLTGNLLHGGAIVTFQRIDKSPSTPNGSRTTTPVVSDKVGTIGLSVLVQKCGISSDVGMKDISMAKIKEGMRNIGLAKEFDIWSSPMSKLLDYDLSFLEYLDQVSRLSKAPELSMQVYYGLRKDHDQQTVQDIYKSGNFVIKLVQMRSGNPQGVGSIRVMNTFPSRASRDSLDFERLRSQTLGEFRGRITTMSQLISKHQFCLPDETPVPDTTPFKDYVDLLDETYPYESNVPTISLRFRETTSPSFGVDKAKAALAALGVNNQTQKDVVPAGVTSPTLGAYSDKPHASLIAQEMLKIEMSQNAICSSPSSLDEMQWSLVMKNCQVMYGWYTDTATNQIKMAPKPAFTLRPDLNLDYTPSQDNEAPAVSVGQAIPNYGVTDGSQIDVVVVESDMRNSLVRNHFEKSSMDSKIAMGYSGVGVSLGTGTNSETQSSLSSEQNKSAKRMIGKYMLPRVTLFLNADDLVPTREFAENVERIRKNKDLAEIRKFHRKFGQFFCHEVTLGGMLVSTKTLTDEELVEQDKNRDTFKQAIGLTVSSPMEIGADSKKETSKDSDQNVDRKYKLSSDNVVFEAVGGNTILASNPSQWCPTVGNHVNWRVIQRADSRMIIDSLVDCGDRRFTDAAEVFASATQGPVTKGISIPKSAKINAQFRFKTRITDDSRSHYLYHDIHKPIVVQTTGEREVLPPRFQGPRAAPYDPKWDDQDAIWTITPIFGYRGGMLRQSHLVDGSTVTIRSKRDPQTSWFLSVLRTSAGIFVPCITTSEQFVWRIREVLKPQSSTKSTVSDKPSLSPLKHDTPLCLTFDFDDNPRGYRDFQDDDRGFRTVEFPPSESKRLVLVESPNKSDVWQDRGVLLLADGDALRPEPTTRVMTLDDEEIAVRIAQFRIDVRALPAIDGMDDDYDILQKDGHDIESQCKEQQKKMKTKNHGGSE